jgi:hypothetical protein
MTYKEPQKTGRLKDVDATARAEKLRVLGWSLFAGLPMGAMAGMMMGQVFLGMVLAPAVIWTVAMIVSGTAGKGAVFLGVSSGSSTPRRKGYSRAEALAVRGEFEAAINAYQVAILEAPDDGEPYLRVARIYRDQLGDPDEAFRWFRRATDEATLPRGQEILARREMAEYLLHQTEEPQRAAPELARLADAFRGTPDGEWAQEELARIKAEMARAERGLLEPDVDAAPEN